MRVRSKAADVPGFVDSQKFPPPRNVGQSRRRAPHSAIFSPQSSTLSGDADDGVPPAENAAIIEQRYKALGGEIEVIHKPRVGHHPHGLDDPAPVVKFILDHATEK